MDQFVRSKLQAIIRDQDAPAIRKLLRNVPDIIDYGAVAGQDCTSAINSALADGVLNLYVPASTYYVDSAINDVDNPVNIFGDHMSISVLRIRHTGDGLKYTGKYGTGSSLKNISLSYDVGTGNNAGTALTLYSTAHPSGWSPDFFIGENVNITSFTGTITRGVLINGEARFGVGVLIGARAITMNNIIVFNATTNAAEIRCVRALAINRMQCYVGAGTTNEVLITAANNTYKSDSVNFSNFTGGTVTLDHVNAFKGSGFGTMTTTANTTSASWT